MRVRGREEGDSGKSCEIDSPVTEEARVIGLRAPLPEAWTRKKTLPATNNLIY